MKFNSTKLKKKVKIHDLLNDDNYFLYLFSVIAIVTLSLLVFGTILYQIIPTKVKKQLHLSLIVLPAIYLY